MAYPSIELAESVVLVTGGGRGIGRATGAAFAARGATVVLGDLDLPVAQEAAAGLGAHALHLDVTSRASFAGCVETVLAVRPHRRAGQQRGRDARRRLPRADRGGGRDHARRQRARD